MLVPILDEVIQEAGEGGLRQAFVGMAHRGRLNVMAHILGQAVRADPRGVQGPVAESARDRGHAVERRRQIPPRRVADDRRRRRRESRRLDAAEPEPPRVDRSGPRGHGARGGHRREPRRRPDVQSGPRAADPDPRRRGIPRPGRGRRDAEPAPPRRATRRAARFTSSPTTRSGSRPGRTRPTARSTPAGSRADSRFRSFTSTPTIPKRASPPRAWRSPTARASSATC